MIDLNTAGPQVLPFSTQQSETPDWALPPATVLEFRRTGANGEGAVTETRQLVAGRELDILDALGIARHKRNQHIICPLPAHDDKSPSFRFDHNKGKYFCSCGDGDIIDIVRGCRGMDVIQASNWIREVIGVELIGVRREETFQQRAARESLLAEQRTQAEERKRQRDATEAAEAEQQRDKAANMWQRSQPAAGTIAQSYLASRGINCTLYPTIRFLPPSKPSYHPCMLVPFGLAANKIGGVHLTYLRPNGFGKAKDEQGNDKITVGPGHHYPLVVGHAPGCDTLFISEGIEDALSAHQALNVDAWAAGSANRLPGMAEHVPAHIKTVIIQQDDNKAGRAGAASLAEALAARGIAVRISEGRDDLDVNSVLQAEGNDGARAYLDRARIYAKGRQLDAAHYERQQQQRAENAKLVIEDAAGDRLTRTMTLNGMVKDMVWLSAGRYVGRISDKLVMKAEDFAAHLAASKSVIAPKTERGQPKVVPTFSLWRESPDRLTVDAQTWMPEGPVFCDLPVASTNNGMSGFNTWAGLAPYSHPDDWFRLSAPFREHLDYLCPVPAERDHFTMWMAHIFQKPGILPHHFFCHVTTTHGIGRNWLASVLVRLLRRYVAPDLDMEAVLEGKYNDQMSKKLLLIFNEVYEPGGAARHRRGTKLRELVNPEFRNVNPKCERQHVEYNHARWLCFSNFEEAIAFDTADNRLVLIENPSRRQPDAYYERLYSAYKDPVFLASCRHWLQTLDISAFNPGRVSAMNDIKKRSLEAQTPPAEQLVQEFLEHWPGDWVASKTLREQIGSLYRELYGREMDDAAYTWAVKRAPVSKMTKRVFKVDGISSKAAAVKGRCTKDVLEGLEPSLVVQKNAQWLREYHEAKNI